MGKKIILADVQQSSHSDNFVQIYVIYFHAKWAQWPSSFQIKL